VIYGGSKNQITNNLYTYDAAGNVTFDGNNWYSYDDDGRLCSVQTSPTSGVTAYGYIYDAEGRRVAKGTIAITSTPLICNPNTTTNGFQLTESYVLDQSGQELTMLDQNGKPQRTNVFAGSQLIATYDSTNLHFHLADPLSTRRMQVSAAGVVEGTFQSLPFGDKPTSSGGDATPLHYTGKERDTESGNDYFEARYYASSMGRFMSPDWNDSPEAVPFADFENPQSLNLYAYVGNNPLSHRDSDGHSCDPDTSFTDKDGNLHVVAGACHLDWWDLPGHAWVGLANILMANSGKQALTGAGQMTYAYTTAIPLAMFGVEAGAGELTSLGLQAGGKELLKDGTKAAARKIIEDLPEGAQKASAKRAVSGATSKETISITKSADGSVTVSRTRPGFDGSQTMTKTIDPSGASKTVQTAVDSTGEEVHYHPKN
jgi:RHS repeat-associated protein